MNSIEYTFETYVTTPANRLARIAAEKICESPGILYNPLYIYGPPGVGKTHLLYAIAKEFENRQQTAIYISGNQFFEEMIKAIQSGRPEEFREKYHQADIVLIDCLQYVSGKEAAQRELLSIVENRVLHGRAVVFAANRCPSQIPCLNAELSTFLTSGLCAEVPALDFEGKTEIITRKLQQNGLDWPIEACRYVALNISSGASQIDGEINKILACRELF